ncbi:MAG: PASTA domain-containing protein [Acidobacteria bacterium]|nr:PASTA domain-containing protein [Acidobacteriota bacterium]
MDFLRRFAGPPPTRRLLGRPEAHDLMASRMPWVLLAMLLWALLVLGRLLWLQVVEHQRFAARALQQHTEKIRIDPIRGELRDRRGESLAISVKAESLFANPPAFYPDYSGNGDVRAWGEPDRKAAQEVASRIAPILGLPRSAVVEKLLKKTPFVWIERQLSPAKVSAIREIRNRELKARKESRFEALDFLVESRREYPRGSLACQILGFVNIDGVGQLGIEHSFNEQLAGRPGVLEAPRDARGRLLVLQENYSKIPANGSTLQLTLDATIQHIVEEALEEGVRLSRPATAYAVVVDPNTGEILAMAGTPTFNPNQVLPRKFMVTPESELGPADREELRKEKERQKAARKVHPVEDAYEPGSTMKIFTAAIALEERKVRLGEPIDCMGGRWAFSNKLTITDTHRHGVLSFEEVLWQSSNVGAARIGMRLSPEDHYRYLRAFGFGEPTGLNFPGETAGRLIAPDRWSGTTQPTFCYGYGLSTSPLQILMAASVLANGGKLMQPILVQKIFNDQGKLLREFKPTVRRDKVVSEETAAMMRETLKGVLTTGTGKKARLEGVEAFGKTGTARKIINGAYDPRRHYASFLGFFPADRPQYGMLFMLDDPAGDVTGGDVAAPLFKRIGDGILRYRQSLQGADPAADLKLSLRDWPASESDEAGFVLGRGLVPDLKGLSLKAAIQRVVLAGGAPQVEGRPEGNLALRVTGQSPPAGAPLPEGTPVKIRVGGG